MSIILEAIPVPLRDDGAGGYRVGKTRVSLDSVLHAHRRGESAEEIVRNFDTLLLADVHAVLAWALLHPDDADTYLTWAEEQGKRIRAELEAAGMTRTPEQAAKFREELLARKKQREQG